MSETEQEYLTHAELEALEREIVVETVETALAIAIKRNFDVGHIFPSTIVGIKDHPALFSRRVYAALETHIDELAREKKLLRLAHMSYGSTSCEFVVHAKRP